MLFRFAVPRLWMVVMAGILVCTTLSACGEPEDQPPAAVDAGTSACPLLRQANEKIDEMQGQINRLKGEVMVAQGLLATATANQKEAVRVALSPNDDRLWTCVSADTTKIVGRFTPAKFDPSQKLVIELVKEGQTKGTVVCPARGSLSEFRAGSSFICPQVGDGPVVCSLPN